jgi:hypothetical protein
LQSTRYYYYSIATRSSNYYTTTVEATGEAPEQAISGDSSRAEPKKPSGNEEDVEAANCTFDDSKSKKEIEDTPKMEE